MTAITIGLNSYDIYGTQAAAVAFHGGSLTAGSAAFLAATSDNQLRSLVMATQAIDAERWQGTKTSEGQALAFPRTGLTRYDGSEVDSSTVPIEIERATYILAGMLILDPALLDTASAGASNVKRVNAKGVEVEFFTTVSGGRFPTVIQKLLVQFLAGGLGSLGLSPAAGGTSEGTESSFLDENMYPLSGSV